MLRLCRLRLRRLSCRQFGFIGPMLRIGRLRFRRTDSLREP